MPWYGPFDGGPWWLIGMALCAGMMLLMMGSHRMGGSHGMHGRHAAGTNADRALEDLRERFASGEITQQEYEDRKKVLSA